VLDDERAPARGYPPPLTAQAVVGGALGVLHERLSQPDPGALVELTGPLMSFIVLESAGQPAGRKGMEESYVEGVANHDGPEPCVGDPRGRSEALDRGRAGGAIEPRKMNKFWVPTPSVWAEGNIAGSVIASRRRTLRGRRTYACTRTPLAENREVPRSPVLVDDAPPDMGRGVACRWVAGRAGKAKVVIP
jgi:hypothetical protein